MPTIPDASTLESAAAAELRHFSVDPQRGFLPVVDPLRRLPEAFSIWEELAADLPKLLATGNLHPALDRLPVLDVSSLHGAESERAMLLLSFFGHGYVWENWRESISARVPPGVAVSWCQVAQQLGRPPVLSYASYALHNWRPIDPRRPIELGNVALLQNFLGGLDEEWFVAVHVAIEAQAGPALAAMLRAQGAAAAGDAAGLAARLEVARRSLDAMYQILLRMPENCDPYIYYNRVRPYIHGFSENPVVYEGVEEYGGKPRSFFGETGAQSTIIPALDAALGIKHSPDELRVYLTKMRDYMPSDHRAFLHAIESGPSIRGYAASAACSASPARERYDACVDLVHRFRAKHLEYAAAYIQKQSQHGTFNSTSYGTGGTPFMKYLRKHRDETKQHFVGTGQSGSSPGGASDDEPR